MSIDSTQIHTFILKWMGRDYPEFRDSVYSPESNPAYTVTLDGKTLMTLGSLPHLRKFPGLGDSRMVSRLMTMTQEELIQQGRQNAFYMTHLGLLAGLFHKDTRRLESEVGSALDGTRARAEWDLQSYRAGLAHVPYLVAGETQDLLRRLREGYAVGMGLLELGAVVEVKAAPAKKARR